MHAHRGVLLEPDEREAGAPDQAPVPGGHPAAGGGLLRLAGGHHLGDHQQHLQGRLAQPVGAQREGTTPTYTPVKPPWLVNLLFNDLDHACAR